MALYPNSITALGAEKITPLLRERGDEYSVRPSDRPTTVVRSSFVMRPVLQSSEAAPEEVFPAMMLPTLATPDDIRELVRYLRKKPAGVTIVEAMDVMRNKTLHPGKITAYEYLGLVERQGDRLKLSARGWDFVQKLQPEAQAFRDLLHQTPTYSSLLEWIHQSGPELVTQADVADFWQEHHPEEIDARNERALTASVVCFFHLCQAAELGTLTIGKRGQPARLRVDLPELAAWAESAANLSAGTATPLTPHVEVNTERSAFIARPQPSLSVAESATDRPRTLILCRQRSVLTEQLQTTLRLVDIESEVIERNEDRSLLQHTELFQAMRRCQAALIVLTDEDYDATAQTTAAARQNVLLEISSAFVLYDGQVVLLQDQQRSVSTELSQLPRCEFNGDELSWVAGVQLLTAVRNFRRWNQ